MSPSRRAVVILAVVGIAATAVAVGVTAGSPPTPRAAGVARGDGPDTRATVETIRAAATVVAREVEATTVAVRTAVPARPGRPGSVGIRASLTPSPGSPDVTAARGQPAAAPSPAATPPAVIAEGAPPSPPMPIATTGPVAASTPASGPPATGPVAERVRIVGGGDANVRAEPTTDADVLTTLATGTAMEVVGPDREADGRTWRNVRTPDGRASWIAGSLVESAARLTDAEPPAAVAPPRAPGGVGLQIRSPPDGARVPATLVVAGMQERPTPDGFHVWAFVRAAVPGAGWYPWHRGEVVAGPDTTWSIDLYLGGPPGTRHEVQVGTVDDGDHAALATFLQGNPDLPLQDLPAGFIQEARMTVTLE